MKTEFENGTINSEKWELENISIAHNIVNYHNLGSRTSKNEEDVVRLHFGLVGAYDFSYKQLGTSYKLEGSHNNIMYSKGLEIDVSNKSKRIETFGVNFTTKAFVDIAEKGNDILKRFSAKVLSGENAILSNQWRPNNFRIQQVISEILNCNYRDELKDLFLLSKSIELLVLQAELYDMNTQSNFIKSDSDRNTLCEARMVLEQRFENPPTISELSRLINLNEYKLKRGFKELFGTTVFGYIHQNRMALAKKLLLDTDKSAKEIAFEVGYSSPQHFSKAFKQEFGTSPNSIRNNPDCTMP